MREPSCFTREEYQLAKVALAREEVPAEAFALLSAWIEGERLLVDDREDVGGINFCRMDSRVMAPLPHFVASFFARRPYKRKAGHYPRWNGFYMLLYRDVEDGWKLVWIRRDSPDTEFVPVFAARIKAVEEINKRLDNDLAGETARPATEKALGRSVVSSTNFLDAPEGNSYRRRSNHRSLSRPSRSVADPALSLIPRLTMRPVTTCDT